MKKFISIITVIVLVLSMSFGVLAKESKVNAQKVNIYQCTGNSNYVSDILMNGHITVVDPLGNNAVIMNGVIGGLLPSKTYYVWVRDLTGYTGDYLNMATGSWQNDPYTYYKLVSFTTDELGNGDFHIKINESNLPAGTYNLQVAINDADPIGITIAATKYDIPLTIEP